MPRNNSQQSETPGPGRARGPVRTSSRRSISEADEAADRMEAASEHAAPQSPTYDEIAEAAYQRYLRRGGADGGDFDDWVEAERELRSQRSN